MDLHTERIASTLLILPGGLEDELARRAAAAAPEEVCGLLLGHAKGRRVVVEREVAAENAEAENPRDRYHLDPDAFVAADNEARAEGLEIVGFWHSHPESPPQPSPTDLELAWEGYSYLIVSVVEEGKMRSWRKIDGAFLEETVLPHELARTMGAADPEHD